MIARETSTRQNALGGASSAATTAALTTPPWVMAIVSVQRSLLLQPRAYASEQRRQGLAAVGRGVGVGHPGLDSGRVLRGELRQRPAGPGTEAALGQRGLDGAHGQPRGGLGRAPGRKISTSPRGSRAARRSAASMPATIQDFVGSERGRANRGRGGVTHEQQPPHMEPADLLGMARPVGEGPRGHGLLAPGNSSPGHSGATAPDLHRLPRVLAA